MDGLCREHIRIRGGSRLSGSARIHGAKNAVLPILAATVLNAAENMIEDCPNLSDVRATLEILTALGCKTHFENGTAFVDSKDISTASVPFEQMQKMRSSVIFLGALAARLGEAHMCLPGGCSLGLRPIDLHIDALRALGMEIEVDGLCLHCYAKNPHPAEIYLKFPSVGATENAVLAATNIQGITTITGAAKEPEIDDLLDFLRKQGHLVFSDGNGCITVDGGQSLHEAVHRVIPDRILAATLMAGVMTCGGDVVLENIRPDHMGSVLHVFRSMGANFIFSENAVRVKASGQVKGNITIETLPYPGFPTDVQSVCMAALLRSEGIHEIRENIFEDRFRVVPEFEKMGANITTIGNKVRILGVKTLDGADVEATDLRAGAALCVAALGAEGVTRVFSVQHIKRGYENLPQILRDMGAVVEKG